MSRFASPTLVCVGNLTIDEARTDERPGTATLGGDAAYAALAARLFLPDVAMLAPAGPDLPPDLGEGLRAAGVAAYTPTRELATVRNTITYHPDGTRTWEMHSSEDDFDVMSVYPHDIPETLLHAAGFLVSAMSLRSQLALTPWLREHTRATIYLDLQEDYLDQDREALLAMIGACHVFLPSEVEAVTLAGTDDLAAAARFFQALGPATVAIKCADKGSLVLDGDTLTHVPVTAIAAVDSTGAGDAYCGGFAAEHLLTRDALKAAHAGTRSAREAISAFGIAGLVTAVAHRQHPTRTTGR